MKSIKHLSVCFLLGTVTLLAIGCSEDQPLGPDVARIDSPADSPLAKRVDLCDPTEGLHKRTTFVETFDGTDSEGHWSFYADATGSNETIAGEGGHPGGFLHSRCDDKACLETENPQLRTDLRAVSIFNGDFRARGVTSLSVDLAVFGPETLDACDRPLCVVLSYDPKTWTDPSDDIQAVYAGRRNIPRTNGRFNRYRFDIPSDSKGLPEGWIIRPGRGTGDDDADWSRVIQRVDQVSFFFWDPDAEYLAQEWELGVDNLRITEVVR